MTRMNVISIDPAQATKGAMLADISQSFRIKGSVLADIERPREKRDSLNIISGINNRISTIMSSRLFLLRLFMGILLLALGIYSYLPYEIITIAGVSPVPEYVDICEIVLGGMLLLGLFTRISSTAGFLFFTYLTVSSVLEGTVNLGLVIPAIISIIFMVTGPGIYSTDQLIRRTLIKKINNRRNRRKAERFSYRAYAENS